MIKFSSKQVWVRLDSRILYTAAIELFMNFHFIHALKLNNANVNLGPGCLQLLICCLMFDQYGILNRQCTFTEMKKINC
jgi:hypothetical protein